MIEMSTETDKSPRGLLKKGGDRSFKSSSLLWQIFNQSRMVKVRPQYQILLRLNGVKLSKRPQVRIADLFLIEFRPQTLNPIA